MLMQNELRLTSLSTCAGCAAKLPQSVLRPLLKLCPTTKDPRLLVDASTCDDAGVYRLSPTLALVQTVDFFTPIVDDPYAFGQIAAANAISDVFAMGGRPITAMNLLAVPADKLPPPAIARILRGGASKVREAKCLTVGGHTIRAPEPIYGLSVTGVVHPKKVLTNDAARPGDLLVLTKPLGVGIATTAVKRDLASPRLAKRAAQAMLKLNTAGHELADRGLIKAATDVTGFGLLGHLANVCRASHVTAELDAAAVPIVSPEILTLVEQDCIPGGTRSNIQAAESIAEYAPGVHGSLRVLLADAQTSGGLLLCVPPRRLAAVLKVLESHHTPAAAIIGRIARAAAPRIIVH